MTTFFKLRSVKAGFVWLVFVACTAVLPSAGDEAKTPSFRVFKDVLYLEPTRSEKMDVYIPSGVEPSDQCPTVVWVHGSGGTKEDRSIREECETLAAAGYVCACIDWTLDTPFRVLPTLDCKNAVRFLRTHAADYNVDVNKIAIGGGSGGGYLALMVGFTSGETAFEPNNLYPNVSSKVQAIIDFYGVYDALKLPLIQNQIEVLPSMAAGVADTIRMVALVQPVTHLTSAAPPVLIVQGKDDPLCDYHQSVDLADDLKAQGVPNELVLLEHVGHTFNFTTWKNQPLPRDLRPVVIGFLDKYIGPGHRSK